MGNTIDKDNFILYNKDFEMIEELTDEDVGNVIKSIFRYSIDGTIPDYKKGSSNSIVFKHFKRTIDINNQKYIEKCNLNRENALKRWKKILYENQDFTREKFNKYCEENGLNESFDEILLEQKKLFDEGNYDDIKTMYNCKGVSIQTMQNLFT